MEVATIFTSENEAILLFDRFIYSYTKILFGSKDRDTAYFESRETGRNLLYYHYQLNDIDHEFSYNYSADDVAIIKREYEGKKFYCFDLSYKSEDFLGVLLMDFTEFLKLERRELILNILISHPVKGLLPLSNYCSYWLDKTIRIEVDWGFTLP